MYDKNPTCYGISDFFMCKNLRSYLIRETHIKIKKESEYKLYSNSIFLVLTI